MPTGTLSHIVRLCLYCFVPWRCPEVSPTQPCCPALVHCAGLSAGRTISLPWGPLASLLWSPVCSPGLVWTLSVCSAHRPVAWLVPLQAPWPPPKMWLRMLVCSHQPRQPDSPEPSLAGPLIEVDSEMSTDEPDEPDEKFPHAPTVEAEGLAAAAAATAPLPLETVFTCLKVTEKVSEALATKKRLQGMRSSPQARSSVSAPKGSRRHPLQRLQPTAKTRRQTVAHHACMP